MRNSMNMNIHTIYLKDLTIFNTAVTADTDILTDDITITDVAGTANGFNFTNGISVTAEGSFLASANFYFVIKDANDTVVNLRTSNATNLAAEAGFTYNITLTEGYKLNFRCNVSTTINYLSISVHGGKMP
jgi:hypothetical protein